MQLQASKDPKSHVPLAADQHWPCNLSIPSTFYFILSFSPAPGTKVRLNQPPTTTTHTNHTSQKQTHEAKIRRARTLSEDSRPTPPSNSEEVEQVKKKKCLMQLRNKRKEGLKGGGLDQLFTSESLRQTNVRHAYIHTLLPYYLTTLPYKKLG